MNLRRQFRVFDWSVRSDRFFRELTWSNRFFRLSVKLRIYGEEGP